MCRKRCNSDLKSEINEQKYNSRKIFLDLTTFLNLDCIIIDYSEALAYWHELSAFGRSTGNNVGGQNKQHYIVFCLFFSFFPPPSSTFLIEGILRSKNLFSES